MVDNYAIEIVEKNFKNYFSSKTSVNLNDFEIFKSKTLLEVAQFGKKLSYKDFLTVFISLCNQNNIIYNKAIESYQKEFIKNLDNRLTNEKLNVLTMTLASFNQRLEQCEKHIRRLTGEVTVNEPNQVHNLNEIVFNIDEVEDVLQDLETFEKLEY